MGSSCITQIIHKISFMMTSWNGDMFRVTGHLWGEFTGDRWFPRIKASDAELRCFLWSAPEQTMSKQSRRRWFETPSRSFWHHCNIIHIIRIPVCPWRRWIRCLSYVAGRKLLSYNASKLYFSPQHPIYHNALWRQTDGLLVTADDWYGIIHQATSSTLATWLNE